MLPSVSAAGLANAGLAAARQSAKGRAAHETKLFEFIANLLESVCAAAGAAVGSRRSASDVPRARSSRTGAPRRSRRLAARGCAGDTCGVEVHTSRDQRAAAEPATSRAIERHSACSGSQPLLTRRSRHEENHHPALPLARRRLRGRLPQDQLRRRLREVGRPHRSLDRARRPARRGQDPRVRVVGRGAQASLLRVEQRRRGAAGVREPSGRGRLCKDRCTGGACWYKKAGASVGVHPMEFKVKKSTLVTVALTSRANSR